MAPAVGRGVTLSVTNVGSVDGEALWTLLEQQAASGNIDLVAQGSWAGLNRGLVYRPVERSYQFDRDQHPSFTRAELRSHILNQGILNLMGVPPGEGVRLGIDRDEDGVLDGDVSAPRLSVEMTLAGPVISWPSGAFTWVLESASDLNSRTWDPALLPGVEVDRRTTVLIRDAVVARFYRLRLP
jgi:hypothetical protein